MPPPSSASRSGRRTAASTDLLETVGLGDAADKKMKKFSGGMLQRVGIAVAMLNDPKLLILDEPTAGLDPRERVRFRNLIHALAEDRIVILSTHIVSDIETIAGQIVMFKDHRLYCCDSPAHICAQFQGKVFQLPAGTLGPGTVPAQRGAGGGRPGDPDSVRDAAGQGHAGDPGAGGCVSRHLPGGGTAMSLAVYEWRKLFRLPALWVFLALCLAFNGLLIATLSPYDRAFFNDTSADAAVLGQRVDDEFLAGLAALPDTENRELLRQSVTGLEDIFETYDTRELTDFYQASWKEIPGPELDDLEV